LSVEDFATEEAVSEQCSTVMPSTYRYFGLPNQRRILGKRRNENPDSDSPRRTPLPVTADAPYSLGRGEDQRETPLFSRHACLRAADYFAKTPE